MKIDILIHVEDPGAVNFLTGILETCSELGLNIVTIAQGIAEKKFEHHPSFYSIETENAYNLLKKFNPSVVLIGTSENPNSFGLLLIEQANILNIYSIGLVDMYCNFDNRFRGKSDEALKYCPNEIFVPDRNTKNQFLKLGVRKEALTIVGNPAYQNAINFRKKLEISLGNKTKTSNLQKNPNLLFIAEGWDRLNPNASKVNDNYSLHGSGASDFRTVIVIEELMASLKRASLSFDTTLRLHPNSKRNDFMPIAQTFDNLSKGGDVYELCLNFDLIVGMTSMLVLEAALLGIPTLAILPDASEKSWMPNLDFGPTKCVSTRPELDSYWSKREYESNNLMVPEWAKIDSSEIIVNRIQDIICQKIT